MKEIQNGPAKRYKQLSREDRYCIKALLNQGCSRRGIAKAMGRSVSTISEEIRRGRRSDLSRYGTGGEYNPALAHQKAYVRRKYAKYQGMKIVSSPALKYFIDNAILELQSPEAISGRLKRGLDGLPSVSRSAIEKYLRSPFGEQIRYDSQCLKRQYKHRQNKRSIKLDGRKFIDERPEIIQNRGRLGDLEADFIVSGCNGRGLLLTATDRRARISFIYKLLPGTIENLTAALLDIKRRYPELTTITTDNDLLFICHKRLEKLLGIAIYFCHPYSSWEKGSVENLNRYIRKYIRKGSNIASYSRKMIQEVEDKANRRFMGVLDFLTPNEFLMQDRQKNAVKAVADVRIEGSRQQCSDRNIRMKTGE